MRWTLLLASLIACSGGTSAPPPPDACRNPLVVTLDDRRLTFDGRFGYRTDDSDVLVLFAGPIRDDGTERAHPPACADALKKSVLADELRIESEPELSTLAYDLSDPLATGFTTDIRLPCRSGKTCSSIRMRRGPAPPAGKLSRCLDVTAEISDGSGGKHALRLIGHVEVADCGALL